jgi:hypothetical protein
MSLQSVAYRRRVVILLRESHFFELLGFYKCLFVVSAGQPVRA